MLKKFFKKRLEKKISSIFHWKDKYPQNQDIEKAKIELEKIKNNLNKNLSKFAIIQNSNLSYEEKFDDLKAITDNIFSEVIFWFEDNKSLLDNASNEKFNQIHISYLNYSQEKLTKNFKENYLGVHQIIIELYNEINSLLNE